MDIIEISPPKKLSFSLPIDLHRVLSLTNLTLRSILIIIVKSHPIELSLSSSEFILEAFQQVKVEVLINWNQAAQNLGNGKLRVYIWQLEQEIEIQEAKEKMFVEQQRVLFEDISIDVMLDCKVGNFLNYEALLDQQKIKFNEIAPSIKKHYFTLRKVFPLTQSKKITKILKENYFKNQVYNYLQSVCKVKSIENFGEEVYLVEFIDRQDHLVQFYSHIEDGCCVVFSLNRVIGYGSIQQVPPIVSVNVEGVSIVKSKKDQPEKEESHEIKNVSSSMFQPSNLKDEEQNIVIQTDQNSSDQQDRQKSKISHRNKGFTKQSFAMRNPKEKVKRRNKSQEKIVENSDEQYQEEQNYRQFLKNTRKAKNFESQKPKQIKVKQISIELTQKILNLHIQTKQNYTQVYVILRDSIKIFNLEDIQQKRSIKFQAIYEQNVNMPTPIQLYKDQQIIFGNQSYLYWVNTHNSDSQWKYVQRKYIYALAIIDELSLLAVGGKNFSKLSYFGKDTSRSNIKIYSCSSSDKREHLFTYDIPGNNVGNVLNLIYMSVPPHNTKLLFVHTVNNEGHACFFFLRIKAFNKVELFGKFEIQELGILNCLKVKYNKNTGKLICLQAIEQTKTDTFKQLKIRSQYQKIQITTSGFKVPLKRYISYHLGGGKGKEKEWMSLVEDNGKNLTVFMIDDGAVEDYQQGKGQVRQCFYLTNGRYLMICSDTVIKIRQKVIL